MSELSHVDAQGRAMMVDVSGKAPQQRMARAAGYIALLPSTVALIRDNRITKGDVLTVARIAGIQAAKRTAELIPLCHPLLLHKIDVALEVGPDRISASSEVRCYGVTGVEMEALTAVSMALLTIYDMCKAVDKQMQIQAVYLVEKSKGGGSYESM